VRTLIGRVQPSHLLHLAWTTTPGEYWSSPKNIDWVTSSLSLYQAALDSGIERVVTAGTCAEYDWRFGYCVEDLTPLCPHTLYGTCKDSLRTLSSALFAAAGVSNAWCRIFFPYGPGEHPSKLVASTIGSLLAGKAAECSSGAQLRDFIYVRDVAGALVTSLLSDAQGPINVGSGEPVSVRGVASRMAAIIGRPDLLQFKSRDESAAESPIVVAATQRLRSLGWAPRYSLDEGLADYLRSWPGSNPS
jgi:nucleoside-diphosphate-sugar epimerase